MPLAQFSPEQTWNYDRLVIFDLDGTLTTGGYPQLGPPRDGVKEAVAQLHGAGYTIMLSTCRLSPRMLGKEPENSITAVEQWLATHGIELDGVIMMDKPFCQAYFGDEAHNIADLAAVVERLMKDKPPPGPVLAKELEAPAFVCGNCERAVLFEPVGTKVECSTCARVLEVLDVQRHGDATVAVYAPSGKLLGEILIKARNIL